MEFQKLPEKNCGIVSCEMDECFNFASYFYVDLGYFICEKCKQKLEENHE